MSITKDLNLFESGNGGELAILSNDLSLSESLYTIIYISLFGGNVEASTLGNEIESEQRFDYWANGLLNKSNQSKQLNSRIEKELLNNAINSAGRLKIKSAIEEDLSFLKKIVNLDINVVILSQNRLEISIYLDSIGNQADKGFQFIWDNAKKEVIIDKDI